MKTAHKNHTSEIQDIDSTKFYSSIGKMIDSILRSYNFSENEIKSIREEVLDGINDNVKNFLKDKIPSWVGTVLERINTLANKAEQGAYEKTQKKESLLKKILNKVLNKIILEEEVDDSSQSINNERSEFTKSIQEVDSSSVYGGIGFGEWAKMVRDAMDNKGSRR